jgi:hypothetical protein
MNCEAGTPPAGFDVLEASGQLAPHNSPYFSEPALTKKVSRQSENKYLLLLLCIVHPPYLAGI